MFKLFLKSLDAARDLLCRFCRLRTTVQLGNGDLSFLSFQTCIALALRAYALSFFYRSPEPKISRNASPAGPSSRRCVLREAISAETIADTAAPALSFSSIVQDLVIKHADEALIGLPQRPVRRTLKQMGRLFSPAWTSRRETSHIILE